MTCLCKLFLQKVNWKKQTENGDAMKKILFILFTVFLLAACSSDELGTPFVAGQEVTLSATMPSGQAVNHLPSKQRISGKDTHPTDPTQGSISLSWDEGDEVLVTVGGKSAVFTLESGEGTKQATFRGTMPADGTSFSVSYPVGYSDDVLKEQLYVENGFAKGLMKMSTKTKGTIDNGFTLSADNALLGLQLTGDVIIRKIVITNKDNNNTYTLDCSTNDFRATDEQVFYIVLPSGTWSGMKVEVYNAEGVVIQTKEKHDPITFSVNNAIVMPELAVHDYVDLGLSVMWATCNVGAEEPEGYGDYFAWGETEPKEIYGWSTYKWSDATGTNMTKYNATDGLTTLLPEDDAAHVKWGGQWRMPTLNEFTELVENTSWENMQINGVKGYLVRSTVPCYTDKHIFLPFAGWRNEDLSSHVYEQGISTRYWSNYATHNDCAYNFFNRSRSNNSRRSGLSIRPVLPKN